MNKFVASKKSILRSNNSNNDSPVNKKYKHNIDEENECVSFRKKYQERRNKGKVKRVARRGNLLNEWTENESSRGEINDRLLRTKRTMSKDSVIYVGTYQSQTTNPETTSLVDLTASSESVPKKSVVYSKSLKTIYFPSKNFDRNISFRKNLSTTSLPSLPVTVKPSLLIKSKSLTGLENVIKERLAVLEIPEQYLDGSEISCTDFSGLDAQTNLRANDYKIINWILEHEDSYLRSASNTSGYTSSLDIEIEPIEEMCRMYGVNSNDTFP